MAKSIKIDGFIKAKSVQHKSISLSPEPGKDGSWYSLSDRVFDFSFEKLVIGDKVRISLPCDENGQIPKNAMVSFLEMLDKSSVKPIDKYPTKREKEIIEDFDRQKLILWQSCMKIAVEIEKAFMCGETCTDRNEACKNVLVSTNNLYEGSLRKANNLPVIPEAREE